MIEKPCLKGRWADMGGHGRARFCGICQKNVYNIEAYSPDEWEQLWGESGGGLCVMRGGESPPERRSRRAILVGAFLTMISPLMAQDGRLRVVALDPAGAVVWGVKVELLEKSGNVARTGQTADPRGELVWTGLPLGDLEMRLSINGFKTKVVTITVSGATEKRVEIKMDVSAEVEGGAVVQEK